MNPFISEVVIFINFLVGGREGGSLNPAYVTSEMNWRTSHQ